MRAHSKRIGKRLIVMLIIFLLLLICEQYILTGVYIGKEIVGTEQKKMVSSLTEDVDDANNQKETDQNEGQYVYLTELPIAKANVGYGKLTINKDPNGNKLSVKREGAYYEFDNGIWAHANSNIYYDISEYSEKYHYLTMYVGINRTSSAGNGAKVWLYTSKSDKLYDSGEEHWTLKNTEYKDTVIMPNQDAIFQKIDISGAKYLRIQAYDNGANGNDHTVFIEPMLITDKYKEPESGIQDIPIYDGKIKSYPNKKLSDPEYELLILQREFIKNVGNYALNRFMEEDPNNKETIEWLMNDLENLRYYILGGQPTGGYFNSLKVLTRILKAHKNDFNDITEISEAGKTILEQKQLDWPKTKGNLYKRMAITISLTHSSKISLWMQPSASENQSDAVVRYEQYKKLYNEGKFRATDSVDITPWFETYNIEEMRYVMHVLLDDEEVIWLNEYTQSKIDAEPNRAWAYLTPHPYMAYVWPNYGNDIYYTEENKEYFNDLFKVGDKKLWDYGITRGTSDYKLYKLWMNFRNKFGTGAVCGGISKTGHCIRGANGIPSAVIGQPGHAAIIYYNRNANGQGYWGIDNDVSGWILSEKGERLPIGWGSDRWYRGSYNIPYIILAQEALNDYNNFVKAEEIVMLADVYADNSAQQEAIYREAIKVQSINLDAWVGLIKLYLADTTKKEEQYYNLAKEMMESLKCFPYTMYDLANKIKPKFTTNEYKFKYSILETRILTEGKNYPNANSQVLQPNVTRGLASYLLGKVDTSLAKFSFDGEDSGKIVLSDRFDGNGIRWDYSLDGRKTWKEVSFTAQEEHKLQLTPEEIASITSENDIYVHIVGVNYNEENIYKIDILESAGLPATLYASDLENRIIGVNLSIEWRYKESDPWTSYSVASPDLTGNKTVQLRQGATGTSLAGEASSYSFTADNQPDTRKYIPVSHLSKVAVSTEAVNNGGAAINALDANYNTRWHSAWNGTDTQRFITIKLDKPVHLSAVEFVPAGGGNGRIVKGEVLGSATGEDGTWVSLADNNNSAWSWPAQANDIESAKRLTKSFEIPEEKRIDAVQYVKIIAHQTNGNWFTARAFNFYQDITKVDEHPIAGVAYSTTETTSEPVIARLVNPSTEITITNNDGKDTYVFTENGNFTFEFQDKDGNKGTATAKVDWIDKNAPTVDVEYKLSDDKKLIAILDNINEDVYLLDNSNKRTNFVEVKNGKIVSITFLDANGESYKVSELNEDKITEKITYKNTTGKVKDAIYYSVTFKKDENGNVLSEVESRIGIDKEGNTIELSEADINELKVLETMRSNPLEFYLEKNQEYEFRLQDKASNITYKKVRVDYIENDTKILASDITYSTMTATNKDVVATIKPYLVDMNGKNCNVEVVNNGKSSQYTFSKNGKFTFQYAEVVEATETTDREIKEHTAVVDWIDKVAPTAKIKYSTQDSTTGEVVATLTNESEAIMITNNGAKKEYTFTKNGEFTFKFEDKAGNKGTATAKVDWIKKDQEKPETPTEPEKPAQYKLGDVNKDGKITATDLLLIKRHLVAGKKQAWILTGDGFKAGDINKDGRITATDLILIKRLVLKEIGKK